MAVQPSAQGHGDEDDGQGVEEHEHRLGVGDDGLQPQVGDEEGQGAEQHRPHPIGGPLGEELDEGLPAAGEQAHRRLQTGHRHRDRQDQGPGGAEVVVGDLGQGLAAVGAHRQDAPALGAHDGHQHIDQPHEQAAEQAGAHRLPGDLPRVPDPQPPDDLHHHDAEGQPGQGVHGVVALQQAGGEGRGGVVPRRINGGQVARRGGESPEDQHGQEGQEQGGEHLPHPGEDLPRPQGQDQRHREEEQGEYGQPGGLPRPGQHLLDAHGVGDGGAPGDGEEGADGQVEGAGEEQAVALSHPAAQPQQAVLPADPQGGHPQQGQAHAGDQQAGAGQKDARPAI